MTRFAPSHSNKQRAPAPESELWGLAAQLRVHKKQEPFSSLLPFLSGDLSRWRRAFGYERPALVSGVSSFEPITDEERGRMRFFRQIEGQGDIPRFGPRFGPAIHLYRQLIPAEVRSELDGVLSQLPISGEDQLRENLKSLGSWYKALGNDSSKNWRYFVNLETLGGYHHGNDQGWSEEIRDWVGGTSPVTTDPVWREDFVTGVRQFVALEFSGSSRRRDLTFKEFLADPELWATSGATHLRKKVQLTRRGRVRTVPYSKWVTALASSVEDLYKYASRAEFQFNKAIKKRETGKVRAVVGGDDALYLKMAYFSHRFEGLATGSLTSLFMTPLQLSEYWRGDVERVARGEVFCPVDQSQFDHVPDKEMIAAAIESLRTLCVKSREDERLFEAIKYAVSGGVVQVRGDGPSSTEEIRYEKGIVSGWRWTALLDTMINYGEWFACNEVVKRRGFRSSDRPVVQGDDDTLTVPNVASGVALLASYADAGLKVNPSKNFIASDRNEYLRNVVSGVEVRGYPARSVNSLCWRNPINSDPPKGPWRAQEIVSQWLTLQARSGVDVWDWMLDDLVGATGESREILTLWLHTPASVGGLGFLPWGAVWVTPEVDELAEWRVWRTPLRLIGTGLDPDEVVRKYIDFKEMKEFRGWKQVEWRRVGGSFGGWRTGPPLSAQPKPGLSWEMRLELGSKIADRDWVWIRDEWLDPGLVAFYDGLLRRASRNVFVDWLNGTLPIAIPDTDLLNGNLLAPFREDFKRSVWAHVVLSHKITRARLTTLALEGEAAWPSYRDEVVSRRGVWWYR